jgi:hypothetical protein
MNFPRTFVLTVNRPIKRFDETTKHLDEIGIKWEPFIGMDNQICRLNSKDTFDFDRAGERLEAKHVAATLTHYLLWKVMQYDTNDYGWSEDYFAALEFDVRFVEGWEEQYDKAMSVMPQDWDLIYLGSCCCKGREQTHIGENVYEIKYPLCGHAIMYRQKSLETLLDVHQKINMPLDIAMYHLSLPKLKVYTILPRIVDQHATFLPP